MELKTYRARSIHEALALVRRDLGPEAAVLGTREVRGTGALGWLAGERLIEVTASAEVAVPSRLPPRRAAAVEVEPPRFSVVGGIDLADQSRQSAVEAPGPRRPLPSDSACYPWLLGVLSDAETPPDLAQSLAEQVIESLSAGERDDIEAAWPRLLEMIQQTIETAGPIQTASRQRRLVALVGPTGVGKTTTIAKLAAHFHLAEHLRVGLITVDTYRIAAVEQLRTYAEILDLPMEVVTTPEDMRQAVARLADCELILMDTAGRSPRDAKKIQELQTMLAEAQVDEVHLVLSCAASSAALIRGAECFVSLGANRLILTKLDEAEGLGHLLPLLCSGRLPLSYLTDGQSVPGDIALADATHLATRMMQWDPAPRA